MRYVLGVDGGGSKTCAVVVNEYGEEFGRGHSGCGNHQLTGIEVAIEHISIACNQALETAQLQPKDIAYVQYGLAGADRPQDFRVLEPALATLPFSAWNLVCDTMTGLRLGGRSHGVVLVCGSGTNAMGRTQSGTIVQVGGFGYPFGDASGGMFLAQEAFRFAIRSWEGRERPTMLTEMIPRFCGFQSMHDLYHAYLDENRTTAPLELTRTLHEAANLGDVVAIRILEDTGRELGIAANAVIQQLIELGEEDVRIVLTGSILQKGRNPALLHALKHTVHQRYPSAGWVIPDLDPVYGALMLAMDALYIPVTEACVAKFRRNGVNLS